MENIVLKTREKITHYKLIDGFHVLHREDGPAIEYANGNKQWCRNGQLHREDGPAIEYANGCKQWWINGLLIK